MNSTSLGRQAEDKAMAYLLKLGYKILDRNWRVKAAEIDIVAAHKDKIFFVEVKYRKSSPAGSGLDYITPKKLAQMHRAAELWFLIEKKPIQNYELSAIEVSGLDFCVSAWLPALT